MAEDLLLEPTQLRRGLDSSSSAALFEPSVLAREPRRGRPAVEGDHQLAQRRSTERLPRDQRLDLADHLDMAPERQLGVDDVLLDGLRSASPPHVTVGEAFPRTSAIAWSPQHQRRAQCLTAAPVSPVDSSARPLATALVSDRRRARQSDRQRIPAAKPVPTDNPTGRRSLRSVDTCTCRCARRFAARVRPTVPRSSCRARSTRRPDCEHGEQAQVVPASRWT